MHMGVDETRDQHAARHRNHPGVVADQRLDVLIGADGNDFVILSGDGFSPGLIDIAGPDASVFDDQCRDLRGLGRRAPGHNEDGKSGQ